MQTNILWTRRSRMWRCTKAAVGSLVGYGEQGSKETCAVRQRKNRKDRREPILSKQTRTRQKGRSKDEKPSESGHRARGQPDKVWTDPVWRDSSVQTSSSILGRVQTHRVSAKLGRTGSS